VRFRILILALVFLLAGCTGYRFHGVPYEPPTSAAAIQGTNWDGAPFSLAALQGKVVLLFFGYTSCPDVCPTTLAEMRLLHQNLGERAKDVAVVFVSVDPERDSIQRLGEYVPLFDQTFYGVHIEPDALEPVKEAYGVIATKVFYNPEDTAAGYSVDHTARLHLIDKAGRLVTYYPYGSLVENTQRDVEFLLR
jgi:protein SCO1/2